MSKRQQLNHPLFQFIQSENKYPYKKLYKVNGFKIKHKMATKSYYQSEWNTKIFKFAQTKYI